jgi:alpha-glucosidase (family GH31 glycosyl hydrolase)
VSLAWWVRNIHPSAQNNNLHDLYGFFHGWDYMGALQDFTDVAGKTIMVPKYAGGVWWSRWYDLNNMDVVKVADDYGSRSIPLDVFVLDMDWHTKNGWSGFTFDEHLFPYAPSPSCSSSPHHKAPRTAITSIPPFLLLAIRPTPWTTCMHLACRSP